MSAFKQVIHTPLIKCLTVLLGFLFSLNVFATGDVLGCDNTNTWESYHELHEWIKNNASNIDSNSDMVYSLAITSLCLGEKEEGIAHLHRASDSGHIVATSLLGTYYEHNQTFYSSEKANLENLNNAIHYYNKGAQMIEATSNYPEGSTDDMPYIEAQSYISYNIFSKLPLLHFNGYGIALGNIINGKKDISYNDTLDVLNRIHQTAMQCIERPALSAWKEKQNIIYQAQQTECNALLNFVEEAYHLEQQRLEIDQTCTVPLKECTEHQELFDNIVQLANKTILQIKSTAELIRN